MIYIVYILLSNLCSGDTPLSVTLFTSLPCSDSSRPVGPPVADGA
jgi:hypothetical protein